MKRFQSTLCATLLTMALASTAFAGNITTLRTENSKGGNITTLKGGNITTLSLTEYFYIALAGIIG